MKIPEFKSIEDSITYYTNVYYEKLTEDPSIKKEEAKTLELIEKINTRYLKSLIKLGKQDTHSQSFKDNIEFLTGLRARIKAREDAQVSKQAFLEKFRKKETT